MSRLGVDAAEIAKDMEISVSEVCEIIETNKNKL